MANKVHIVPHFHWDREWYFTAEESKILLVNDMEEVLEILENCRDYPYFVLDGQTSILEDYFALVPENRERVEKLVQEGKLIIGPWYTQTDEMVAGGESIVRNLLYGIKDCHQFGNPMMIGYLPDSFGQSARMPQILNGFNIERSMFWRGVSERMGTDKTEFYWQDDDGSKVIVQLLPLGYAIGKYLPVEKEALKKRMEKYLPVLERGAVTDHILVPNGHDQMPLQRDIFQVMDSLKELYPDKEFFLSRYEDVFEKIENTEGLDTLKGEFLDGKYMRVHRSIFSSRADLKALNTAIENGITNLLEPLASIAYKLGFEYHHGLIEAMWKELMKNHAHDSLGCCCSDKVHRAIGDRYFLVQERLDCLIRFYMRKITDAISCEKTLDKLTVFNLLPYEREGTVCGEIITKMKHFILEKADGSKVDFVVTSCQEVDAGLIDRQIVHYGDYDPFIRYQVEFYDRIPSMGYETYLVREAEEWSGLGEDQAAKEENFGFGEDDQRACRLENQWLAVDIAENGSLRVEDKITGKIYDQVLLLEDSGDDGDGYDYSPPEEDMIISSQDATAKTEYISTPYSQRADVSLAMSVPKDLESRKKGIRDGYLGVKLHLELKKGSPVLEIAAEVDNRVKDHRLRLLIPGQDQSGFSVSDNQFGCISRPVRDPAMDVWQQEKWSERPDSIYPFLTYVTGGGSGGLSVVTNSVREYEFVGEDYGTLAITLMRCVGVLGKENLLRRPGRPSGIKMRTPDSQMQGVYSFALGITTAKADLAKVAKEYNTPFITYNKMPYNAMKLNDSRISVPYKYSLFRDTENEAILSVLKKAEDKPALIARFYTPKKEGCSLRLQQMECDLEVDKVKLNETDVVKKAICGKLEIGYNEVVTFRIF